MNKEISTVINKLEAVKQFTSNGGEYWTARDLMPVLGYSRWENFETVVLKAQEACKNIQEDIEDHFREATKMIGIAKGAKVGVRDYFFDRYACYLIAQNGSSSKTEIAAAQTYFAIQTRRQELADNKKILSQRLHLRDRVTKAVKELNIAAKTAGVQNYAAFHNAGYKGLYSMGLADIKKRKGLKPKEDLFDRAGRAELAANEFRLTQAEEKVKRERITNERHAIATHKEIGEEVRATIRKIGGMMPEDLPPELSLKKLGKESKKLTKES